MDEKRPKVYDVVNLRSAKDEKGEWFAIRINSKRKVHFWHFAGAVVRYYSFRAVSRKYDKNTKWCDEKFRELLEDLMSPKPSVGVTRFAVNGQVIFSEFENAYTMPLPLTPEPLNEEESAAWREQEELRIAWKKRLAGPAPFILYAKHPNHPKEYAWKLFPEIQGLESIKPGDLVLVKTALGAAKVKVLRIEEAGDQEQPTQRVIKRAYWNRKKKNLESEKPETPEE